MLAAVFTAGASLAVAGLFSSFFGSSFTAVVGASVLTVVVAALVAAVAAVADGGGVLEGKNQIKENRIKVSTLRGPGGRGGLTGGLGAEPWGVLGSGAVKAGLVPT